MSASLLEQTRLALEEVERAMGHIAQDLKRQPRTHREKILQTHRVNKRLEHIQERSTALIKTYDDEDGSRAQEIDELGQNDIFGLFYSRLKEIRDYHRKFPSTHYEQEMDIDELLATPAEDNNNNNNLNGIENGNNPLSGLNNGAGDAAAKVAKFHSLEDDTAIVSKFSGEECLGRFVDLHAFHQQFLELRLLQQEEKTWDYQRYVLNFENFDLISPAHRSSPLYLKYLEGLFDYLVDFHRRAQPLQDVDSILKKREKEVEKELTEKGLPSAISNNNNGENGDNNNNNNENNNNENNLFCNACCKRFASLGVFNSHLSGKKHLKAAKELTLKLAGVSEGTKKNIGEAIFRVEKLIGTMCDVLREQLDGTLLQIEKKQSRTLAELEAETEELLDGELATAGDKKKKGDDNGDDDDDDDASSKSSDGDDDEPIYNPKGVPLGFDGKPIPYWLYKLHGLNIEYKCEICGNFSYWGPRNFERHFQEFRHMHGMRCLDIPNTRHFHNITRIQDAIDLHQRVKQKENQQTWRPDVEEEFEDGEGNVLNRKTYEDLKRQGLL